MEYQLLNPINNDYSNIEQILTNRGIECNNIPHYMSISKEDVLSPLLLANIMQAVKIIIKHLYLKEGKIFIVVDSDCDGYTSAAVLLNYLHSHFPSIVDAKFSYGFHNGKSHGIELSMIPPDTTLVIAPDSSSNDYEQHRFLKEHNIDVLVIDHHEAPKVSEYACVVNNQLCDYPTKSLSGVGVVYKVCQLLDKTIGINNADNYLDLVALGLIADMMDQRDYETAYLIHEGLKHIRNPYIKTIINKNNRLNDDMTPIDAAFYIAPQINAITRMGTMEEKKVVFESLLEWKSYDMVLSTKRGCGGSYEKRVEQAVRDCTNAKSRQNRAIEKSFAEIENLIAEQDLLNKHKLLVIKLDGLSIDRNLSGLTANHMIAKYKRPTVILNKYERNGEVYWEGSARGLEASRLSDFKKFVKNTNLVELAEGHPNAFGFGILDKNFEAFMSLTDEELKNIEFSPYYKVDFIWSCSDVNYKDVLEIGGLKHLWGKQMNEPLVAIENIRVNASNISITNGSSKTLKIILPNGVTLIKFKSSEEEYKNLYSDSGCVVINAVGKCQKNEYFSLITPQIVIENYDIISRQQYYF